MENYPKLTAAELMDAMKSLPLDADIVCIVDLSRNYGPVVIAGPFCMV